MVSSARGRCLIDCLGPDRNAFALIRLGAALAVLVSHNIGIATGNTKADPLHALTGFTLGQHAVNVFFILSGVLVSLSLSRAAGLREYMVARLLRIYPGFAVCVLLTALVLGPLVSSLPADVYLRDVGVFRYMALTLGLVTAREPLPGVFAHNPFASEVNLSLWTLKYEMLCYLALAGVSLLGLKGHGKRRALTLIVAAVVALYALPGLVGEETLTDNLRRFGLCFGLGALAFTLRQKLVLSPLLLLVVFPVLSLASGTRFSEPALLAGTAYATLVAATFGGGVTSQWANRHDLSYGVYLYGWPVAQTILMVAPSLHLWELQFATALIVPVVAALSWLLVEKPCLALRPRFEGWISRLPGRGGIGARQVA